jgi:hypothetical protein
MMILKRISRQNYISQRQNILKDMEKTCTTLFSEKASTHIGMPFLASIRKMGKQFI